MQKNTLQVSTVSITTASIVCKTSCTLKYDYICDNLEISDNIIGIEYQRGGKIMTKGLIKRKKKNNKNKLFFNQFTINLNLSDKKYINCKVFTNGKIQMTGCRNLLDAVEASNIIIENIDKIDGYNKLDPITVDNYEIKLLNCIFNIGNNNIEINRKELSNIISNNTSYLTEYEPNYYPGVIIKYRHYLNIDNYNWSVKDVCKLLTKINCHACVPIFHKNNINGVKLITLGHDDLYKIGIKNYDIIDTIIDYIYSDDISTEVTIIVFRTGNIMITGAQKLEYINMPYQFIINLINKYKEKLII